MRRIARTDPDVPDTIGARKWARLQRAADSETGPRADRRREIATKTARKSRQN